MRTFRPVIDTEKCVKCLRCFLVCPDGAIDKSGEHLEIDYDYCKGCGVCNRACKLGAITHGKGDGSMSEKLFVSGDEAVALAVRQAEAPCDRAYPITRRPSWSSG